MEGCLTSLAYALVAGLPETAKKLLCTSYRIDALEVSQLLDRASAILKDDTAAAELIVSAAKPEQLCTVLISAKDSQSNIVCHRCGGANSLASIVRVDELGKVEAGEEKTPYGVIAVTS